MKKLQGAASSAEDLKKLQAQLKEAEAKRQQETKKLQDQCNEQVAQTSKKKDRYCKLRLSAWLATGFSVISKLPLTCAFSVVSNTDAFVGWAVCRMQRFRRCSLSSRRLRL